MPLPFNFAGRTWQVRDRLPDHILDRVVSATDDWSRMKKKRRDDHLQAAYVPFMIAAVPEAVALSRLLDSEQREDELAPIMRDLVNQYLTERAARD